VESEIVSIFLANISVEIHLPELKQIKLTLIKPLNRMWRYCFCYISEIFNQNLVHNMVGCIAALTLWWSIMEVRIKSGDIHSKNGTHCVQYFLCSYTFSAKYFRFCDLMPKLPI
jgi:hypothetical protein